mmetsp:Transcript_101747/g.270687  ORF Transcript_101747/g.270687 Transcript_101747/m.270687 type:complete len:254 (-) Transcript_101747:122-883(-)
MATSCSPERGARPRSVSRRSAARPLYCTSRPVVDSIARRTRGTAPLLTACLAELLSLRRMPSKRRQTFWRPPCEGCLSISPLTSSSAPARMCAEALSAVPDERTTTTQARAAAGGSLRNFRIARITAAGKEEVAIWLSTSGAAGGASQEVSLERTASTSPCPAVGCSRAALAHRKAHSEGSEASPTPCIAAGSEIAFSADGTLPFRGWLHTLPAVRSPRSPLRPPRSVPRSALLWSTGSTARSPLTFACDWFE